MTTVKKGVAKNVVFSSAFVENELRFFFIEKHQNEIRKKSDFLEDRARESHFPVKKPEKTFTGPLHFLQS